MHEEYSRWSDMKYRSLETRGQYIWNGVSNYIVVKGEVRERMDEHEPVHEGPFDYSE